MIEKKNGVFELEKEEMDRVSGGGGQPYDPSKEQKLDHKLTEHPHCPRCITKVDSYEGVYKCKTAGCPNKGHIIDPRDLIWK